MRSMRHVVASAVVLAVASVGMMSWLGGCAQGPKGSAGPLGELPGLEGAGLKLQWSRGVQVMPGEEIKKVWRSGTSVFVHTTQSRLFAVDASSGALNWETSLGSEAFELYRPVELAGKDTTAKNATVRTHAEPTEVLAVSRGTAFVLDKFTGNVKRKSGLGIAVAANPVVVGDTVCVGGANRFLGIYLDRLTGAHWTVPSPNDFFGSAPIVANGSVIVASGKGQLWKIDPNTGDWGWKDRKTNGQVVAGLAADKRAVFVPCLDKRVYAFTLDAGAELWETQLEGRLDQAAMPTPEAVLVPSTGRGLYALDPLNGSRKWEVPGVQALGTAVGKKVWVGMADGSIAALSLADGSVAGSAPMPDVLTVVRNTLDNQVIVVNRSGMIGSYVPR